MLKLSDHLSILKKALRCDYREYITWTAINICFSSLLVLKSDSNSIWALLIFTLYEEPGSSVGKAQTYWSSGPSSIPARGEIFSTVNGVPLHTAVYYQPFIVLIWLNYCLKRRKIACHPPIHPSIHPSNTLRIHTGVKLRCYQIHAESFVCVWCASTFL